LLLWAACRVCLWYAFVFFEAIHQLPE
jgi:hypothetical protein